MNSRDYAGIAETLADHECVLADWQRRTHHEPARSVPHDELDTALAGCVELVQGARLKAYAAAMYALAVEQRQGRLEL